MNKLEKDDESFLRSLKPELLKAQSVYLGYDPSLGNLGGGINQGFVKSSLAIF